MAKERKKNLLNTVISKANALDASANSSFDKLNERKKEFNDKKSDIIGFFQDFINTLGLNENFVTEVNNFLSGGRYYETKLKNILINCFETNIACNLGDTFKNSDVYPVRPYFSIKKSKLDFFGILKINLNSTSGQIFFGAPGDNTLNRSIKIALDDPNILHNWRNLLWIEYNPSNDYIDFYVHQSFANQPVNSLVIGIVNQINIIPKFSLMLNVFDDLYGSFSSSIQPTKIDPKSLFNKLMLNKYTQKILDGGDDIVIDDSFFNFTNEELFDIERKGQNLTNNFLEILSCNNAESVITPNDLYPILNQIISAGTFNEEIKIIEAGMSTLEIIASKNVTKINLPKFRLEFYSNIFKQLTGTLTSLVYTPQFLTLMMVYFRLANPTPPSSNEPISYTDFKDFLKKTKNILICIVLCIFKLILLLIVVPLIIKRLTKSANKEKIQRNKEKYELYVSQYLALRGLLSSIENLKLITEIATVASSL